MKHNLQDWVIYNDPDHAWHLMFFKVTGVYSASNRYTITFGTRSLLAEASQISPISDYNKLLKLQHENSDTDI